MFRVLGVGILHKSVARPQDVTSKVGPGWALICPQYVATACGKTKLDVYDSIHDISKLRLGFRFINTYKQAQSVSRGRARVRLLSSTVSSTRPAGIRPTSDRKFALTSTSSSFSLALIPCKGLKICFRYHFEGLVFDL